MSWIRRSVFLIFVFSFAVEADISRLAFYQVDENQQLPHQNVNAFTQDHLGFLWLATEKGVVRFDGYRFHQPDELQVVSGLAVTDIAYLDRTILIATRQQGFYRFHLESRALVHFSQQQPEIRNIIHNRVNTVFVDQQQSIWLGSFAGLNKITATSVHSFSHNPVDESSIPAGQVLKVIAASGKQLWLLVENQLALFDTETELATTVQLPRGLKINDIYPGANRQLWLATNQGALLINQQGELSRRIDRQTTVGLSNDDFYKVFVDSKNNLWLFHEQGIDWIDHQGRLYPIRQDISDQLSLHSNLFLSVFEDDKQVLWLGQLNAGVARTWLQLPFSRVRHTPLDNESLSHNFILDVAAQNQGLLWLATASGLDAVDPTSGDIAKFGLSGDSKPKQVQFDPWGKLWILNQQYQLIVFDTLSEQFLDLSANAWFSDLQQESILQIKVLADEAIWILAEESVWVIDPRSMQLEQKIANAQLSDWPIVDLELLDGQLWLATVQGEVLLVDRNSFAQLARFHRSDDPSFSAENIRQLLMQGRYLWVATNQGAFYIDSRDLSFRKIDQQIGLPSDDVVGMVADVDRVWLATKKSVAAVAIYPELLIESFNPAHSVPNIQINSIAMQTRQPWLYLATSDGLFMLNRYEFATSFAVPAPKITELKVENMSRSFSSYNLPQSLKLTYAQNDLRFDFSHFSFLPADSLRFEVQLVGYKEEWSRQRESFKAYTNLDKGSYRFQIRTVDIESGQVSEVSSIHFRITPPIWLSYPAYAMYFFLSVFIVIAIYLSYQSKLAEQKRIAQHLQNLDRLKDEFLANTSHELKTPLNGIIGLTHSLLAGIAGALPSAANEQLQLIGQSGKRLLRLVDDILDHKQLDRGTLSLHKIPCDLRSICGVVIENCAPLAQTKSIALINQIPKRHLVVLADENRLQQILFNLISNAIKYTNQGQVTISAIEQNGMAQVCVTDTGVGIRASELDKIFNPFERAQQKSHDFRGGTGLGLSVTKALIELHGGKIWATSEHRLGSKFYFTIPVTQQQPQQVPLQISTDAIQQQQQQIARQPIEAELEQKDGVNLVLVVDDEPVNLKVVSDILKLNNFEVLETTSGTKALELVESHQIALIVLDVMMPELSGYEVTRQVREHYSEIELPILLLSARHSAKDIAVGMQAGANAYVAKPVDQLELLTRVNNLMELRRLVDMERQREKRIAIEQTYNRLRQYFPKAVVDFIVDGKDLVYVPQKQTATILFADLVNFTELSEQLDATVITAILSEFVEEMAKIVEQHQGVMNEILGDGLVVLFGVPNQMPAEQQANQALQCGLAMQARLQQLSEQWLQQSIPQSIQMRIGIHQDRVSASSIGSKAYRAYRAVGVGVNLASRIQHKCEPGAVLVSATIYKFLSEQLRLTCCDQKEIRLKGIRDVQKLFCFRANS